MEKQQNNPLHGLKLETMVTELVEFYDWKILYAALRLECFNNNPNMPACLKFLKKTEWARERIENFYLYRFKRMPKANTAQFSLKPRERGFADGVEPREPQPLTVELVAEMRAKATADYEAMKENKRSTKFAKSKPSNAPGKDRKNAFSEKLNKQPSQDPNNPWGK